MEGKEEEEKEGERGKALTGRRWVDARQIFSALFGHGPPAEIGASTPSTMIDSLSWPTFVAYLLQASQCVLLLKVAHLLILAGEQRK